jgi:hypothetical protein
MFIGFIFTKKIFVAILLTQLKKRLGLMPGASPQPLSGWSGLHRHPMLSLTLPILECKIRTSLLGLFTLSFLIKSVLRAEK